MNEPERKIFVLTIKEAATKDEFMVYAEQAEQEAVNVSFKPDQSSNELIRKLHGRGEFGFLEFPDHEAACSDIGQVLFDTFFVTPQPVYKRYCEYKERSKELRIALQIPRSLYYLPWEVIRDPSYAPREFISRFGSVTRCDPKSLALYDDWPDTSMYVFLLASTDDYPLNDFTPAKRGVMQFRKIKPATYDNFGKQLSKLRPQPLGLVFFGHGNVREREGYLNFVGKTDGKPDPRAGYVVSSSISAVTTMRIAYILACESAWADQKTQFEFSIAGSILLRTSLAFVVGAQTKIDSSAAKVFFDEILDEIGKGMPLDLAIAAGRRAVYHTSGTQQDQQVRRRDWWVPVLYAKTTDFDFLAKRKTQQPLSRLTPDEPLQTASFMTTAGRKFQELFSSDNDAIRDLTDL